MNSGSRRAVQAQNPDHGPTAPARGLVNPADQAPGCAVIAGVWAARNAAAQVAHGWWLLFGEWSAEVRHCPPISARIMNPRCIVPSPSARAGYTRGAGDR